MTAVPFFCTRKLISSVQEDDSEDVSALWWSEAFKSYHLLVWPERNFPSELVTNGMHRDSDRWPWWGLMIERAKEQHARGGECIAEGMREEWKL